MKLSDAIVMGSTLVKFRSVVWCGFDDEDTPCGCLIGTGVFAIHGINSMRNRVAMCEGGLKGLSLWPWLSKEYSMPPEVKRMRINGKTERGFGWEIVSGLAMKIDEGKVTFEQALEWIRQNEPQEEEVNGGNEGERSDCARHESGATIGCGDPESVGVTTGDGRESEATGIGSSEERLTTLV